MESLLLEESQVVDAFTKTLAILFSVLSIQLILKLKILKQ